MFRIGVIGCGWIVRLSHIPAILKTPEGIITAFYSRTPKSAKKTMKGYHRKVKRDLRKAEGYNDKVLLKQALKSKVYTNLEEFFNVIDGVDIATSPDTHMKYAKIAAEHGKSIMLEKPPSRTLLEVEDVYDYIKEVPLFMYTQRMYDNQVKIGRTIIDSGRLGKIKSFRGCLGNEFLLYVHNKEQFWNPKISGGGALLDLCPHVYSVFRNWFGLSYKFESVREIDIGTVMKTRKMFGQRNYAVEIDDKAIIDVKFSNFENGDITARFEGYWGNKELYPKDQTRGYYFRVEGDKAIMSFPYREHNMIYYKIENRNGILEKIPCGNKLFSTGEENVFRAFIKRQESKNAAWFAKEMMEILQGGYISHNLEQKELTRKEIYDFMHSFNEIENKGQRNNAVIETLFPIEKKDSEII
ncbi:MAG: Gfo/Idh/MocA family oxidoreductase [Candidatus Lokiarchaeota archaeon]|nr:Gfo/Idh/MocA family oxidoreductase [Candidatus Lokiarchaeota archaeon]